MSDLFEICGIKNDEIIEAIKKKAAACDERMSADELRMAESLQHNLNIDRRWDIVRDTKVTSHRRLSGKIIVALKNKTMKFYKWYTDRLFDQQVEFNHVMWESYYSMKKEIATLREEIEKLKSANER